MEQLTEHLMSLAGLLAIFCGLLTGLGIGGFAGETYSDHFAAIITALGLIIIRLDNPKR